MSVFRDRDEAGRRLADRLAGFAAANPLVLALPRGGVVVAAEVARVLRAPLDVLIARKLGVPWHPELGAGAIAELGAVYLDDEVIWATGVTSDELQAVRRSEEAELARRVKVYRGGRPLPDVKGRTVILVDDGIATGSTMHAGVRCLRRAGAGRIIVAAPVAANQTARALEAEADEVVCLVRPTHLGGIGAWYESFDQVSDAEVLRYLGAPAEDEGRTPGT